MTQILEAIVGLQWGDEGRGKIVDASASRAQSLNDGKRVVVVRYQGGSGAGHTTYIRKDGQLVKFATHAAPTGITNGSDIAIGPDVAFSPIDFQTEIESAMKIFGYDGRIIISERTGILLAYHKDLDAHAESNGTSAVGSTKEGMGPFYMDNANRKTRITFADYISPRFPDRLRTVLELKKAQLISAGIWNDGLLDKLLADHEKPRRELAPFAERLEYRMQEYLQKGHHIIIEGAQAAGLDVNMGTIPDTTASHLLAPYAFASLGLPRRRFRIWGVEKVYPSRVGLGTMPTLSEDGFGEEVVENAGEFGSRTGRRRRVGYPDLLFVRRSAFINDCDGIYLMRVDNVQDKDLKVCVKYKLPDGSIIEEVPISLDGVKPIYADETFRRQLWDGIRNLADPRDSDEQLRSIRQEYVVAGFEGLPRGLNDFRKFHDEFVRYPIVGISIGAGRDETVYNEGISS